MISKVLAFVALFGAAIAAPVSRQASSSGQIASGAGFNSTGTTTAGAAADNDSGVASAALEGIGSVIGVAGPGFAQGAALASPSL